eukprot:758244-Hanusia_phi.AAC.3
MKMNDDDDDDDDDDDGSDDDDADDDDDDDDDRVDGDHDDRDDNDDKGTKMIPLSCDNGDLLVTYKIFCRSIEECELVENSMHGVAMKKSTLAISSSSIKYSLSPSLRSEPFCRKSGKLGIFLTPTSDGDKTAYAKFSDVTIVDRNAFDFLIYVCP